MLAVLVRVAVRIYSVPSQSMQPSLSAGDLIVVTPYWRQEPARGDVIVFHSPGSDGERVVKRVIAIPGDLVDSDADLVRVGGHPIPETYLAPGTRTRNVPPQLVPSDHFFVLGDNREVALDSRTWGPIPRRLIAGRARLVLWSSARSRIFKWIE
jgi:signal peptidase I